MNEVASTPVSHREAARSTMRAHTRSRDPRPAGATADRSGLPIVAIVGRPNVGKSTLFNRLCGAHLAIVHDQPGVTRDRHYADASVGGKRCTLVDTGGFDPLDADPLKAGIAAHVRAAIDEADAIVFVSDATTGPQDADRAAVRLLRASGKPVFYVANKADSPRADADAFELYRLGVSRVFAVSALHGRGVNELESALEEALPQRPPEIPEEEDEQRTLPRVALVGRPNAGKSSLINRVLGENRALVDERPGTTRDAIDTLVERGGGKRYVLIDTAGIRRKASVAKQADAVESLSVLSAIRSIERAHVVIALCDAHEGVAEQDAKILGLAEERGRAMIVGLSKSDLLTKSERAKVEREARDKLTFLPYVPIVVTSAKTGRGVADLFATIDGVCEAFYQRVPTAELNRFFETVIERHPPPTMAGRAPRLYYVTQAQVAPPTFVVMTNAPDAIHFSYRRYLVNQLRKHFGFEGAPLRVHYRGRRRRDRR